MSVLMDNQMQHIHSQSWDDLKETNKAEKRIDKNAEKFKKAWFWVTLSLMGILSLSSCWNKSVDEKVLDIIEDKQEQVDDLSQKEAKLIKEIKEVRIEKTQAEEELKKAKRLKR